jgi:hypothetical protein
MLESRRPINSFSDRVSMGTKLKVCWRGSKDDPVSGRKINSGMSVKEEHDSGVVPGPACKEITPWRARQIYGIKTCKA